MPGSSCGCALPAKTNCTGRLGSLTIDGQLFDVGQNQIGALVGGEAARKADGQRIGTQHAFRGCCRVSARFAAALGLLHGAAAAQIPAAAIFRLRCVSQSSPSSTFSMPSQILRLAAVLVPAGAQVAVVETEHLRRQPGGDMDAVGDVADGDRIFRLARKERRSTWRGKLRRAAPKRRWRGARASAPARSCRNFRRSRSDSRGPAP